MLPQRRTLGQRSTEFRTLAEAGAYPSSPASLTNVRGHAAGSLLLPKCDFAFRVLCAEAKSDGGSSKRAPSPSPQSQSPHPSLTARMAPVLLKGMTRQPAYKGGVACWDRQLRLRFDLRHWTRCVASVRCWSSCSISRFTMRSRTSPRSPICILRRHVLCAVRFRALSRLWPTP